MIELKGVAHFSIGVSDLETSRKFYTEVLGLTLVNDVSAFGMARAKRVRDGIPVDEETWNQILAAAAKVKLAPEKVDMLARAGARNQRSGGSSWQD